MANFHETLVLNKYLLPLFGIDSIGKKIVGKNGVEIFTELKYSINEGYTEEGNTIYLQSLLNHQYPTRSEERRVGKSVASGARGTTIYETEPAMSPRQ